MDRQMTRTAVATLKQSAHLEQEIFIALRRKLHPSHINNTNHLVFSSPSVLDREDEKKLYSKILCSFQSNNQIS
jgi:hypothetical protein